MELVECGVNILTGASMEKILETYKANLFSDKEISKLKLYGDGKACSRIVKELVHG